MDLDALRDCAAAAAAEAGRDLLRRFRSGLRGETKGLLDVVTEADRDSERLLRERLLRAFPGDRFLGEEEGEHAGDAVGDGARLWAVDPLDGTINYLHGHPFF